MSGSSLASLLRLCPVARPGRGLSWPEPGDDQAVWNIAAILDIGAMRGTVLAGLAPPTASLVQCHECRFGDESLGLSDRLEKVHFLFLSLEAQDFQVHATSL